MSSLKTILLFFFLVLLLAPFANTTQIQADDAKEIEIKDIDAEYKVNLLSISIPTRIEPLKKIFISHVDLRSTQHPSALNISTKSETVEKIFISHTDTSLSRDLSASGIGTHPSRVTEIFVSHCDANVFIELTAVKITTPPSPVKQIFISYADSTLDLDLERPSLGSISPVNQPPVAKAGKDQSVAVGTPITFDASASYDPDGSIVSYSWDFGDGTTSSKKKVTHSYSQTGFYTVTLTVTDDKGAKSSDQVSIEVTKENHPPVIKKITVKPEEVILGKSSTITAVVEDPDGDVLKFRWSCDAGTISGKDASAAWTAPNREGRYHISLEVDDGHGGIQKKTFPIQVIPPNRSPIANAGPDKKATRGKSITLDGSASYDPDGSIVFFEWDFGDGATGTGKVVTHTYSKTGVYSVVLTVTDDEGAKSSDEVEIEVVRENNPPIIKSISAEQKVVTLGGSSKISASTSDPDGDILSYKWSCEEGNISGEGSTVTWKAPEKEGKYKIALRIEDGYGGVDEKSISILVVSAPPPPKPGEPYIDLHGQKTEALVGEEVILNLSVVNPITSAGTLKVQLILRTPSGWSIKSGEFGAPVGGLQTASYEIEQGRGPQTVGVHILANEPFEGFITGYMDYYFIQEPKSKFHKEINLPVKAKRKPEKKAPPPPETPQPPPNEEANEEGGFSGTAKAVIIGVVVAVVGGIIVRLIWRRLK